MEDDFAMATNDNEKWMYRIYLVGFPEAPIPSKNNTAAKAIKSLVPEALVLQYGIFHRDVDSYPQNIDNEDIDVEPIMAAKTFDSEGHNGRGRDGERAESQPNNGVLDQEAPDSDTDDADIAGSVYHEDVRKVAPENMDDDSTSVASMASHDIFSPAWIEHEALCLLARIQHDATQARDGSHKMVLLAGYGFGGFVIKQAIIIANTTPKFYDVALNVVSLLFFSTPHRCVGQLTWEELLLDMLKATKINYRGRLSLILSRLMDAVSQLSHSFYTFAAKYPITNFVGIEPSDEQDASKFGNDFEEVVPWPKQDDNNPEFCDMDDLNKLESLRTYFAPSDVLAPQFNGGAIAQVKEAAEQDISKTYFEALQSLSHSRWVIYETRTLHNSRELNDETEIYHSLLSRVHLKGVRGGSIQITGPAGHGKSALIKLVSQKLKQESSVLIVENIPNPLQRGPISLYGICASFIHQIISQRPALFQPVQNLMADILVRNAWSEAGLKTLLSSMFQHSQGVDFLVVIYDYETWPSHIQAWWTEVKSLLPESCGSSCTFLTSSHKRLDDFAAAKVRPLNLAKKFKRYRSALIRAKTSHLIAQGYGSPSLKEVLREDVKDCIISTAKSFQGSFAATTSYLTHMFGTFALSSVDTIERQIAICPQTERDLYIDEIAELGSKPASVFTWATAVLSWMLLVARPLRIEELAAASAIISTQLSISDIQKKVSMDMERDLQTHLGGLVVIENRYARVISILARDVLCQQNPKIWKIQQSLETNGGLTELCLHYLKIVLGDVSEVVWQKCLSQVSYRHQGPLLQDPALEFLDYACQFWPAHFLQVSNPNEDLIGAVIKFLKTPVVADRWFQLYLLSTSTWSNPLSETGQTSSPLASTREAEPMSSEKSILSGAAADEKARLSAVQMASYVGLASVIPFLLTSDGSGEVPEKIHLRHGYSERDIMLLDRGSRHYLECAIADDNDGLVKELFNVNRIGVEDCFPLHMAALAGNLKTVKVLLDILPDPGKRDLEGRTPLHMAAICGRTDIISVLAGRTIPEDPPNKAGINKAIDSTDNKFQTPLIIATRMGNVAAASLLVELNADVTMKDETGKTAMHYAVLNCPQVVETFLNENEDIAFIEDNDKCTAVHIAARSGHVKSIRNITNAVRIAGRLAEAVDICDNKGRTPLHYAAENGHQEVTEVLADGGDSAALEDNEGKLPAELAAAHGHLATLKALNRGKLKIGDNRLLVAAAGAGQLLVVQYLLQNGVSPDGEKSSELLPLSVAASMGHVEIVSTLLRSQARINIEDSDRRTPLHHATIKGRYDVVQMLLAPPSSTSEKANISAPDSLRYTPLHHAALVGHTKIMQLLLDNHANPEARSSDSETPLHLAVEHPEAVKILLGATNNPNMVDILHKTPLHKATSRKCLRSAQILIKGGANIDALDDESRRPVYHAISQNDLPMVKEFFKGQVDGIEPRDYEWDDLELAVEASSLEVLQFFINGSPRSVKQTSDRGRTLLNVAAEQHSQEVLVLLLDSGSDVNHSDYKGRTPLYDATATDNVENMRNLLARGADVDKADEAGDMPLHVAARRDVNEAVSILIDAKASINQPGNNKSTPLYLAAYKGKYENVKALLKSGADVNICSGNGWSPLHAGVDNLEITKLLVAHGADINHPKNDGWRPLHLAVSWGYTKIVTFLLEEGADPNLKNDDGETPLHVALRRVNIDVTKVLLNYEGSNIADVHLRNAQELAPIHLAVMHCTEDVVKMFIQKGADFKSRTGNDTSCLVLAIEQNPEVLTILLDREVIVSNEFWDYQDLVLAYWAAIKKDQPECVKILIDTTARLLDEVSAEGFNGLETHLRNKRLEDNDEPLCNRFVDLGLNPFKRRQDNQKSAFELGVMSRDKVKMKFIDSCMKFIPDDLSTSELGFRELRIATEMDKPDLWKKLELLKEKNEDETDQDDWRLDHFLHQSAPRVIYAEQKEETLDQPTRTPTALILPPRWHAPDADVGARVQILPNGLEVFFKAENLDTNEGIICIRADHPFPPRKFGLAYFELTIDKEEPEPEPEPEPKESESTAPIVCIGLCGEFCNLIYAHPGWKVWSAGYHGDNGKVYEQYGVWKYDTKQLYGPGNTIGCGVDYESDKYFFTLDGEVVGEYSSKIIFRKLYPCISHCDGAVNVKVNFGESDFVWSGAKKLVAQGFESGQPRFRRRLTDRLESETGKKRHPGGRTRAVV